ncbi:MAG TPA: nucleotidyl transferase AbiEii/AbiGii toxin family protein [Polyangiaceae bacterium]|nr:nucleotidyl transferase AbiEii/AbiGii toxin family protein [Polyangiaceae bacterium]
MKSPWRNGAADILTYEPEELLGTKMRALFQRKKGRDLFDLSEALARLDGLDPAKIVACFSHYMQHEGRRVTRDEFEDNLAEKIVDDMFLNDVPPLLALGTSFDAPAALERVRETLISRLPQGTKKARKARGS